MITTIDRRVELLRGLAEDLAARKQKADLLGLQDVVHCETARALEECEGVVRNRLAIAEEAARNNVELFVAKYKSQPNSASVRVRRLFGIPLRRKA